MPHFIIKAILLALTLFFGIGAGAQKTGTDENLTREILHMDSIVFGAFNSRDLATFKNAFAEDLEFYHDKGGLTDYQHTVNFLKSIASVDNGLRRTLIAGSTEVYPIPNYGAMQMGSHTFCDDRSLKLRTTENGKPDCGTFRFVHIWKKAAAGWKITRVVSYGH